MKLQKSKFKGGLIWAFIVAIACAVAVPIARAQNSLDTTNIFQSAELFFANNPTNLTWIGNKLQISTAAAYQNNQQFANTLKGEYNVNDYLSLGGKIENAGIAGTVESYQASIAYALINSYAIKVMAGIEPGYNHEWGSLVIEPYVVFMKKLTPNTYTLIQASEPIYVEHASKVPSKWSPAIYAGVGFTYGPGGSGGTSTAFRVKAAHTLTAFRHLVSPGSY